MPTAEELKWINEPRAREAILTKQNLEFGIRAGPIQSWAGINEEGEKTPDLCKVFRPGNNKALDLSLSSPADDDFEPGPPV